MIEVQLVGYTADLDHLVLDLDGAAGGRYQLVVDADLFATVDQLRDARRELGRPVGDPEEYLDTDDLEPEAEPDEEPDEAPEPERDEEPEEEPSPVAADPAVARAPSDAFDAPPRRSPAEIQALLRAGRSPRSVAREAGTDVAWIERWLQPILAERSRVLERAHGKRLERPRLGPSRDPLRLAVERNLRGKAVAVDDLAWDVARRRDGRWKVTVRFSQRGRSRSATWTYDPGGDELRAASELARELGHTRARRTTRTGTAATTASRGSTPDRGAGSGSTSS